MAHEHVNPRVLTVAIVVIAACSFLVYASFDYVLTPMLADLGLSTDAGNVILKVPSLAALLIVFVAGRIGDRIGHRKVILALSTTFALGCLIIALAQGMGTLLIGMFLQGISATAINIVLIGLLVAHFVEPKSRTAAFAAYGVAYPAVYLFMPVLAGWLVTNVTWRLVAGIWVIGGAVIFLAAFALLPRRAHAERVGEVWTPILAGVFCVGIVQFISHASDFGLTSWPAMLSIATTFVALGLLVFLYRKLPDPSLSIDPLKRGATTIILVVVILVPMLNTFFYLTMTFQYLFGMTAFQTALVMIPSQIAGILGSIYLSDPLTNRFGLRKSGTFLLLGLACVMALAITFSVSTPAWLMVVYGCLFGAVTTAVDVVILNALMSTGDDEEGGNTAAYEGSAEEIGAALGVVAMSAFVVGAGLLTAQMGLTDSGLSADESARVMAEMQSNATSPQVASSYSYPLPDGTDASEVQKQAIVNGLRMNGAAGVVISLIAAGLYFSHRRGRWQLEDKDQEAEVS